MNAVLEKFFSFVINQDTVFDLVEPGNFVGMRFPPNAIEYFFVAEVMDNGIAENNMIDEISHTFMPGELYLVKKCCVIPTFKEATLYPYSCRSIHYRHYPRRRFMSGYQ